MSPRYFARLWSGELRQSQREREMEEKIEHAVAFAFSPVRHPVKTWRDIIKFFKPKDRQSS
jgi:hypothetical protein